MVPRSRFTCGSRRVSERHAVSMWMATGLASMPQADSAAAQSWRKARGLAWVPNWSTSAVSVTSMAPAASSSDKPAASSARR